MANVALLLLLVSAVVVFGDYGESKRKWGQDPWTNPQATQSRNSGSNSGNYQTKRRKTEQKGNGNANSGSKAVSVDGPHAWETKDRYPCWENKGYKLCNNVWGDNPGPQSMWADSYSTWGVHAQHSLSEPVKVKSYPFSEKMVNQKLSKLTKLTTKYSVTVPKGNDNFEAAYDIWDSNKKYEIMLWMVTNGGAKPIAKDWTPEGQPVPVMKTPQKIGGHTWMVYKGTNNVNDVFSFVRKPNAQSGEVDAKAILDWIQKQGWFAGDIEVGAFQFGFEISSAQGGDFICNEYSVDFK